MKIIGPYITKEVVVPEHTVKMFDEDAYWYLDWEGNEDPDGTFAYAKVGFPRVADAQRQHQMETAAREAERAAAKAARPKRAYRKRVAG